MINLCDEGSDDNGEWLKRNTIDASVSPLLVSRKRPRENGKSFKMMLIIPAMK
jgi:hypothetical protein